MPQTQTDDIIDGLSNSVEGADDVLQNIVNDLFTGGAFGGPLFSLTLAIFTFIAFAMCLKSLRTVYDHIRMSSSTTAYQGQLGLAAAYFITCILLIELQAVTLAGTGSLTGASNLLSYSQGPIRSDHRSRQSALVKVKNVK